MMESNPLMVTADGNNLGISHLPDLPMIPERYLNIWKIYTYKFKPSHFSLSLYESLCLIYCENEEIISNNHGEGSKSVKATTKNLLQYINTKTYISLSFSLLQTSTL